MNSIVLFVLRWRAAHDSDFPRYARFANAFIETSLPSVVIFVLSHHMEPTTVFSFWPPMLYFVFILLSTLRLDFWLSLWTGAVAAVQQFLLVLWLIPLEPYSLSPEHSLLFHLSRSIVLLAAGAIAGIVAGSLRRQFDKSVAAAAARDRITNMFGQHVSPAVVDRLLASRTDPPSEMREVCVLFLDIRGFTAMTRVRPAGETVALLNDFFAEMIDVVDRNHGIINKFLGDGFLALFGAPLEDPKAAVNALAAARGMLEAVDRWNKARPQTTLRIGIGIHLGEAVTGTVGSPQRKEYTVIGDTVNLAARLEQLTKETGVAAPGLELGAPSHHRRRRRDRSRAAADPRLRQGSAGLEGGLTWYFAYGSNMNATAAVRGAAEAAKACAAGERIARPARWLAARLQQAGARADRAQAAGNIVAGAGRGGARHAERAAGEGPRRARPLRGRGGRPLRAPDRAGGARPTPARRSRRSPTSRC